MNCAMYSIPTEATKRFCRKWSMRHSIPPSLRRESETAVSPQRNPWGTQVMQEQKGLKEAQLCVGDPSRVCLALAILFALQFDAPIGGGHEAETGIQQCATSSFDPGFRSSRPGQ